MQTNRPEAEVRLEKLEELRKLGINPYPSLTPEHEPIEHVRKLGEGKDAATAGRIESIRLHGKLAFVDLVDPESKIQLFFSKSEVSEDKFKLLSLLDNGDYIWLTGELFTTKAGELTIKVKDFQLLSKSLLPIPTSWQGLEDVETRYRQRALDFKINPEARKIIHTRSQLIAGVRAFLDRHGFTEVQTPALQPIPGGAAAKPFITHYHALDGDYYLRIAAELYLKRLVVGGFERVYDICTDFRNEGLSHMHSPEFMMCEFYWAYQDYKGLVAITQQMIQELVKKVHGKLTFTYQNQELDFSNDFAIKKYVDIIKEDTGLDVLELNTFDKLKKAVNAKKIKFEGQKIKVWSELVDELFKKISRPKIIQPTFVIDYPVELQPLAKKHRDDPRLAEQFQLVLAGGLELVKAYSELNDPLDQEARFKEQVKMGEQGWDEAQMMDDNYIEALKFGMPPTAGWGMGIERLTMILTNQHSIKEVIPFPTLRSKN